MPKKTVENWLTGKKRKTKNNGNAVDQASDDS